MQKTLSTKPSQWINTGFLSAMSILRLSTFILVWFIALPAVQSNGQQIDRKPSQQEAEGLKNKGRRKVLTYFPSGEISNISYFKNGQLVKYLDYFPNKLLIQKIEFKDGEYNGKYWMWSEKRNKLIKGRMLMGRPISGDFENWNNELQQYQIIKFHKGKIIHVESL